MQRSDIKRFIREMNGNQSHLAGEELFSNMTKMIQDGERVVVDIDSPKRSGYVIACDPVDNLSTYNSDSMSIFGFEGFFEDEIGDDVFCIFSIDEIIPGSFEKYGGDIRSIGEIIPAGDDSEPESLDLNSMTRDFMMEKFTR